METITSIWYGWFFKRPDVLLAFSFICLGWPKETLPFLSQFSGIIPVSTDCCSCGGCWLPLVGRGPGFLPSPEFLWDFGFFGAEATFKPASG